MRVTYANDPDAQDFSNRYPNFCGTLSWFHERMYGDSLEELVIIHEFFSSLHYPNQRLDMCREIEVLLKEKEIPCKMIFRVSGLSEFNFATDESLREFIRSFYDFLQKKIDFIELPIAFDSSMNEHVNNEYKIIVDKRFSEYEKNGCILQHWLTYEEFPDDRSSIVLMQATYKGEDVMKHTGVIGMRRKDLEFVDDSNRQIAAWIKGKWENIILLYYPKYFQLKIDAPFKNGPCGFTDITIGRFLIQLRQTKVSLQEIITCAKDEYLATDPSDIHKICSKAVIDLLCKANDVKATVNEGSGGVEVWDLDILKIIQILENDWENLKDLLNFELISIRNKEAFIASHEKPVKYIENVEEFKKEHPDFT